MLVGMGRHTGSGAAAGNSAAKPVILVLVAVIATVLVGFALRGLMSSADPSASETTDSVHATTNSPDAASTTTATPQPATENATPTDEETSTGEATSPGEDEATSQPPTELTACVGEVTAGDDFAAAAEQSAAHWIQHYDASVELNAGRMSLEQAQADWDETKAAGPEDMERYQGAQSAYDDVFGSCADLADVEVPADYTEQAQDCAARSDAVALVAQVSQPMNSDWRAHLDFMETKDEADPVQYVEDWREDVVAAPNNVEPYQEAVAQLDQAPACSL